MFEKSLTDVVKGIRSHPRDEAAYISTCIAEIREELKSTTGSIKLNAVLKLFYLQSFGYDISWAAFHFVDVMAMPRFKAKRSGFLAAAQSFNDNTDVMLLTTNLFRKAFASSQYEVSLAVGTLAKIATPDLARDLLGDVTTMLGSSRPLVRKKAVLCLYKLLQRLPEALPAAFPRLRERLDDPDPAVVAATVNVLTELAAENPTGYLGLAPALYKVLTSSSSNWTLIKVHHLLLASYYLLLTTYYLHLLLTCTNWTLTTHYPLPTTYYLLHTTYYLLPTTYHLLFTTCYLLRTPY